MLWSIAEQEGDRQFFYLLYFSIATIIHTAISLRGLLQVTEDMERIENVSL